MQNLIRSTNHGTTLTEKGKIISGVLVNSIPAEINMPKCSIALGKFNYVVLLKQSSFAINSGIEQRDAAIKVGALGATTLIYMNHIFVMPGTSSFPDDDSVQKVERDIAKFLISFTTRRWRCYNYRK